MLRSVMMTEKTRVTAGHHATSGSLGRSTVRAHPATRTGWWIPVTALSAWLVYRQVDAATAVEAALVGVAVFITLLGFSVVRASAHRWWGRRSAPLAPLATLADVRPTQLSSLSTTSLAWSAALSIWASALWPLTSCALSAAVSIPLSTCFLSLPPGP